jgi:dTDP-4-amino-4,6-dideoxygalactose transaminase
VIAVHLFGQCAALDEIARICKEKNLLLIEDCAQCIGADYDGKRAGSWGEFGGFSFYPTKNLAAAGDAGLITTKEKTYEETLRMLRHHGSRQTYLHERVGWNSRLDELQAAVLRVKLKHLPRFNEAFTIRAERRDAIREALAKEGIASSVF